MKMGGCNVLITNPRDIPGFVKELAKHKFTVITGVNTLFNALLNHPDFGKLDFSHLQLTIGGGMAVQKAVADRWKQVTGKVLLEAYGLTETSPGVCINPLSLTEYNGTIGLPLPSTEIEIRDDSGKALGLGGVGELCVRGPQVMKGYWQRPEETAKVINPDGFFATGDVARVEEKGFVRIVDRKKDMVLVSGFNVYPNEVEDVVAQHAGVLECAVIGVPDDKSGEAVKLFVVKKDPALSEEDIRKHCEANLTGYKRPRYVEFRDRAAEDERRQDPAPRAARRDGGAEEGGLSARRRPPAPLPPPARRRDLLPLGLRQLEPEHLDRVAEVDPAPVVLLELQRVDRLDGLADEERPALAGRTGSRCRRARASSRRSRGRSGSPTPSRSPRCRRRTCWK